MQRTWKLGLELTLSKISVGTKPKGPNNESRNAHFWLKAVFWPSNKRGSMVTRGTVVREKPHTGTGTISAASMGLTDATN